MRWKHCCAYFFHIKTSNYGESAESSQLIQFSSDPRSTVDLESSFFSKKKAPEKFKKTSQQKSPKHGCFAFVFYFWEVGQLKKKQPTAVFPKNLQRKFVQTTNAWGGSAYGATSQSKGNEELLLEVLGITATLGICSLHHTTENLRRISRTGGGIYAMYVYVNFCKYITYTYFYICVCTYTLILMMMMMMMMMWWMWM